MPVKMISTFDLQVGTKRYLAPEMLDETIDKNRFDSWNNEGFNVDMSY